MLAEISAEDNDYYVSLLNAIKPAAAYEPLAGDEDVSDREWFVAVTNPNCEGRVITAMHERGILTVAPVIRFWRTRNRVRKESERQLMPRYVMFGLDRDRQNIVNIEGLERVVRNGDLSWARVPAAQVSTLRLRALTGEFDPTVTEASPFIRWLVSRGEIAAQAILEDIDRNRAARNRVSRSKSKKRKKRK